MCVCKGTDAVEVSEILYRREKGCGSERVVRLQKKSKNVRGDKEMILNRRRKWSSVGGEFV